MSKHYSTKKPLIYLAAPYSHDDPAVRQARFEMVNRVAAELIQQGKWVYSPISHSHPIALATNPTMDVSWQGWLEHDLNMLAKCDELLVVMADGWRWSLGVLEEINRASELGLDINYMEVDSSVD